MGDDDDRVEKRRKRAERLAKIVTGLTDPDATGTIGLVRSVAQQLEYDRVVEVLETSENLVDSLRVVLNREGGRYTMSDAAERAGVSPEVFRQVNLAAGFADPAPDAKVFTTEDIETIRTFVETTTFFGEDIALQNIRVMGSSMARVADAFISSFATAIGRRSQMVEFTDEDLADANEQAVSFLPGAMQAMSVLLRRQIELKTRADIPRGDEFEGVDALDRAVGFCDLVGYTSMAQQISTAELAAVLRDFETVAADLTVAKGGQVVKLIGDEVMFVTRDAATAFDIGLSLVEHFSRPDAAAPVRVGIAAGRVIVREGDYFGQEVNLAARIVKLAQPSSLLAPAHLDPVDGFGFEPAGEPVLKGFDDPVALVSVTRVSG